MSNIIRPDWNSHALVQSEPAAGGAVDVLREIERKQNGGDNDPSRNGLPPALLARWEAEGGIEANVAQAQRNIGNVLASVDDAAGIAARFDALPAGLQHKVLDGLRLAPGRGIRGAQVVVDTILASLSPSELDAAIGFLDSMSDKELGAVLQGLGGGR